MKRVTRRPERAKGRLLAWIRPRGSEAGDVAFVDTYVSEGWTVLEAGVATMYDDLAARSIVDAVKQACSRERYTSTLFVADRGTASAACKAVIQAHHDAVLNGRCGLVTVDAFAESAVPTLGKELAALENLATIWTVRRPDAALRKKTFAHHTVLQTQGRETHFLVLPDAARSLSEQLTDIRSPLGRETRWLLEPVHSRSA
jgi:hypothetical protein